jgi:hypothetical protein
MNTVLPPEAAGAILGVSPKTLANWRTIDYGPPWVRVGGRVRYLHDSLIAW